MFEFIIFVVFVVISIMSEMSKNKDKTKNEEVDLESLEDFFKKRKSEPPPTEQASGSVSSTRSSEFDTLEAPVQGGSSGSTETAFPDFERSGNSEFQRLGGPPPIPAEEERRAEQKHKQKKAKKSKKPKHETHEESEGPCLDREPSLTGAMSLESMSVGAFRTKSQPQTPARSASRSVPLAWNRRRFIDAVVMSELLQRYDLNRVFGRIPTVRKDS